MYRWPFCRGKVKNDKTKQKLLLCSIFEAPTVLRQNKNWYGSCLKEIESMGTSCDL